MPPQNFSWIDPDRVAGLARPSHVDDLHWLRSQGIDLVITLTEDPLPRGWINQSGLLAIHEPINDFEAPTPEILNRCIDAICKALDSNLKVAIHCRAGIGRTGTILAAYMVAKGSTARDAITRLRSLRRGSVETPEQARCVEQYELKLRPPDSLQGP